jgi:hypothetical protein
MDPDLVAEAGAAILVLAHFAVLVWSGWMRKGIGPVLVLNLVVSGAISAWWAPHLGELGNYIEVVWVFVAFEFAVFAVSLLALFRVRIPHALLWIAFAANALLATAALLLMLTFKLDRLI